MNEELNSILLRRRGSLCVEPSAASLSDINGFVDERLYQALKDSGVDVSDITPVTEDDKKALIATLSENLGSLGYRLSADLAQEMTKLSYDDIVKTSDFLVKSIEESLGGNVEYSPLYPGFPESVMNRSSAQLYFDALVYYISGYEVLPYDIAKDDAIKATAASFKKLKTINLADEKAISEIASDLMSSNVALSPEDKKDLLTILNGMDNYKEAIPDKIPNKENLTWLTCEYMKNGTPKDNPFFEKFNSATDVIRLIVARNNGDVSLTEPVKFKSLPRSEARVYAEWFADHKGTESEIYNRKELFKKISETYHFRNFKDKDLNDMLDRIYSDTSERSFNSKRDKAIEEGDFTKLLSLYDKNPGQMGADISRIAAIAEEQEDPALAKALLCQSYKKNVQKMSSLNLLKNEAYLDSRTEKKDLAVYSPKKGLANPYAKVDNREPLSSDIVEALNKISKEELEKRYSKKRPLGKVYIDEKLSDIKIPSQQRDASEGTSGLTFGSKLPVTDDVQHLRPFIWWTNCENRREPIDIDLSVSFFNENMEHLKDIAFYDLRSKGVTHSGDVRDGGAYGGKGGAEFIDIDFSKIKDNSRLADSRYVVFTVNSYSNIPFSQMPCKFGWMESDKEIESNFDISKAKMAMDLNADSTRAITAIYDIENEQMIWLDRNPREQSNFGIGGLAQLNTAFAYSEPMAVELYRALNTTTPDLYSLMMMHAEARGGEIVSDPKEADTIFTLERVDKTDYPEAKEFCSAFDADLILGDLVSDELSPLDKEYFENLEKEEEKEKEKNISNDEENR